MAGGKREKIEFTDELVQKVCDLASKNMTTKDISQELKISYPIVRKLMKSPEYQGEVKNAIRRKNAFLVGLAMKALEEQLRDGNLDAVKVVFKVAGALEQEQATAAKADSQLVVVMPGAQAPVKQEVVIDVSPQNGSHQSGVYAAGEGESEAP